MSNKATRDFREDPRDTQSNNAGDRRVSHEIDERETANDGNWESQRPEKHPTQGYQDDSNDNSGGAGSTGSAATNSNDSSLK